MQWCYLIFVNAPFKNISNNMCCIFYRCFSSGLSHILSYLDHIKIVWALAISRLMFSRARDLCTLTSFVSLFFKNITLHIIHTYIADKTFKTWAVKSLQNIPIWLILRLFQRNNEFYKYEKLKNKSVNIKILPTLIITPNEIHDFNKKYQILFY